MPIPRNAKGKRRALGQHFLKDPNVIQCILDKTLALSTQHLCHSLLEIGPGKGALTNPLLSLANHFSHKKLLLAERDYDFIDGWKQRFSNPPDTSTSAFEVEVLAGDFLEISESQWLQDPPLAVVSNLPYSSATAIITKLANFPEAIPWMVLMFQAEVAQRLRATPHTKSWGSLSIWIQNQWEVSKLISVPPKAFSPPPKVNSEVLVFLKRSSPLIPKAALAENKKLFETLLKTCFLHRRKMLRSGLSSSPLLQKALERSQIDGTKRAEALEWNEWEHFFHVLLQIQ